MSRLLTKIQAPEIARFFPIFFESFTSSMLFPAQPVFTSARKIFIDTKKIV
jgi:hypothetical protein